MCFEECNGKDDGKECNSNDQIQNERNHNNGVNSIGLPKSAGCVQDSKNINDKKDYPVSEIDASDLYYYGNVGLNDPEQRSDDYFNYNAESGGGNMRYCRYKHAYNEGYNPYFFPNFQLFTKPYMYNKRFPEQHSGQYSQFSAQKRQRVNFPKCQMNVNHKSNPSMIKVFHSNQYERHSSRWYRRSKNVETKETMYWISRSFDAIKNCAYEHFSKFIDEKVKPQRISHERFDDNLKRTLRRNMSRYIFEATRSDPRFVSPRIMIDCIIDTIKNPHNVIEGERQCRQFEQVIGYMDKNSPSYWCEIVFHEGQFVVVRPLTNYL
ncbi:unnamed protein product [Mytilus coruscus]|uniref:Uncharacterized protein n=1 Tax=Mytilus coruscus TaxID=42192 RepID=A0A6J8CC36_MYTCO|nr:unnamed protein product [Mytilus coruscus]